MYDDDALRHVSARLESLASTFAEALVTIVDEIDDDAALLPVTVRLQSLEEEIADAIETIRGTRDSLTAAGWYSRLCRLNEEVPVDEIDID